MKKLSTSVLALAFWFLFNTPVLQAQVAITAFPFLQINNDARSMGMAGSNVALKNTRSGMHLNPATFGKNNTVEISSQFNNSDNFHGTDWLPSMNIRNLYFYAPQIIAGFEKLAVGYQYTYIDLGTQLYTNDTGGNQGTFQSYERANTFSFSYDINQNISVGAGFNAIKSSLEIESSLNSEVNNTASQISWDLGFYADYPFYKESFRITPSFGWSITDIGQPVRYPTSVQSDPMPTVMRGGLGLKVDLISDKKNELDVFSLGGYLTIDKMMARRNEDGSPMGPIEVIFKSWDSYTRFNGIEDVTLSLKDQLRKQLGAEITLLEMFSLRFGSYYEHPQNGDRKFNTIGIGLHLKYFTWDYATINPNEDGHPLSGTQFMQFTVSYPFK